MKLPWFTRMGLWAAERAWTRDPLIVAILWVSYHMTKANVAWLRWKLRSIPDETEPGDGE